MKIPLNEKSNLTMAEASAYFSIGLNRLREITNRDECQHCVVWNGAKRLIRRAAFETYLAETRRV